MKLSFRAWINIVRICTFECSILTKSVFYIDVKTVFSYIYFSYLCIYLYHGLPMYLPVSIYISSWPSPNHSFFLSLSPSATLYTLLSPYVFHYVPHSPSVSLCLPFPFFVSFVSLCFLSISFLPASSFLCSGCLPLLSSSSFYLSLFAFVFLCYLLPPSAFSVSPLCLRLPFTAFLSSLYFSAPSASFWFPLPLSASVCFYPPTSVSFTLHRPHSDFLCFYLYLFLSLCPHRCLSLSLSAFSSLSVYFSLILSVCLSVYLPLPLSVSSP